MTLLHLVSKRIFSIVAADISLIRKHYHYMLRLWQAPWSFSELMQDVDFGVFTLLFFFFPCLHLIYELPSHFLCPLIFTS